MGDGSSYAANPNNPSQDEDNDYLTDAEEYTYGTNPLSPDTDHDGLADGFEVTTVIPWFNQETGSTPVNVLSWDGDGDNISDYDEWYSAQGENAGSLPGFAGIDYSGQNPATWGGTYFDYDGDFLNNPFDPHPSNPDADGDGMLDGQDPYPEDYWNSNPPNISDYDNDGISNSYDPEPNDPSNYSSTNGISWYADAIADYDSDSTANYWDDTPYGNPDPPTPTDSDGDGFSDSTDPASSDSANYSWINGGYWYSDIYNDSDSDGTANWWDDTPYGTPPPPPNDYDEDGLDQWTELSIGTSDGDQDSDDDGLTDYEEHYATYTSPTNKYSLAQSRGWGDSYTDYHLTCTADADQDTIPDRIEQHYGLDPHNDADAEGDLDADGISNAAQFASGIALDYSFNSSYDQDGDGMLDVYEDFYGLNKSLASDATADPDGDGLLNCEEQAAGTSPHVAHTFPQTSSSDLARYLSRKGNPAGWVTASISAGDMDGDSLPDAWEHHYRAGLVLRLPDASGDADDDGLTNYTEYRIGTDPLAHFTSGNSVHDLQLDSDGDGLTNAEELAHGTQAWSADTDGDGISDGTEIAEGTDPMDPASNSRVLIGLRVTTPFTTAAK